jgi:hypothetical protein
MKFVVATVSILVLLAMSGSIFALVAGLSGQFAHVGVSAKGN